MRNQTIFDLLIFDTAALAASFGEDIGMQKKMLTHFLDYHFKLMHQFDVDVQRGNFEAIERMGHRVKSAAASVGACQVAACWRGIEHTGASKNIRETRVLQQALRDAYSRFRKHAIHFLYQPTR